MKKIFFPSLFCIGSFLFYGSIASANFTPGKGVYSFYIETDNSIGDRVEDGEAYSNKRITNIVEIGNEFGITDNASIEVNFYTARDQLLAVEGLDSQRWVPNFQYVEVGHKLNFNISQNWTAAMENLLRMYGSGKEDDPYKPMYQIRGYLKHSSKSFFKQQRVELYWRRRFQGANDTVRIRLTGQFQLPRNVTYLVQFDNFYNVNANGGDTVNSYQFKRGIGISESILFTGPVVPISKYSAFYVFLKLNLTGEANGKDKGLLIGYAIDLPL